MAARTAMNRITSTFRDRELEATFQRENVELNVRRFARFSLMFATAIFMAYGYHDLLVVPTVHQLAWNARYGFFLPIACAVILFTYSRHFVRWHQAAMLIYGMAINITVLWIAANAPSAGFFIYSSYAILFVTVGPFIAKMNVRTQLLYTLLTLAVFNVLDIALSYSALTIRFSINLTLLSMGFVAAFTAHQIERQSRQSFLLRRTVDDQVDELNTEKGKSDALLLNILPKKIADRLKADNKAIADGFSEVTVLFSDIVGFTKMSERLSPEQLVRWLNEVFSSFDDMAEEFGVEKIKTIGDAYMVVGGLHGKADHATAIADMALRMQSSMKAFGAKLGEDVSVRIGINSGPVVAGVIGKKKFIYDVWGDTVNTASRMESHSTPGSIQVTEETYALLKDAYAFEGRGEIEVKGKGKMNTYFLLSKGNLP